VVLVEWCFVFKVVCGAERFALIACGGDIYDVVCVLYVLSRLSFSVQRAGSRARSGLRDGQRWKMVKIGVFFVKVLG